MNPWTDKNWNESTLGGTRKLVNDISLKYAESETEIKAALDTIKNQKTNVKSLESDLEDTGGTKIK